MKQMSFLRKFRESQIFWPLVAWVLILIFDAIVEPGFFKLGIIEDPVYGKHLYGNLVDIFNNGANAASISACVQTVSGFGVTGASGCLPATISKRMMPTAQRSVRRSTLSRPSCSGDM